MSRLRILTFVLMFFSTDSNSSVGRDAVDKQCYCYDMGPRHKVPIFLGIYYVDSQHDLLYNDSSTRPIEKAPLWRLRPKYLKTNFLHTNQSY